MVFGGFGRVLGFWPGLIILVIFDQVLAKKWPIRPLFGQKWSFWQKWPFLAQKWCFWAGGWSPELCSFLAKNLHPKGPKWPKMACFWVDHLRSFLGQKWLKNAVFWAFLAKNGPKQCRRGPPCTVLAHFWPKMVQKSTFWAIFVQKWAKNSVGRGPASPWLIVRSALAGAALEGGPGRSGCGFFRAVARKNARWGLGFGRAVPKKWIFPTRKNPLFGAPQ